jgi:BCD family chlorophyll transporter-like MFS transporter
MPFALLVLAKSLGSAHAPEWVGQISAAIAILLVGAGVHVTQTVGLALATDLTREDQQANVVGLMYVSLLVGSITAALAFGAFLVNFTPGRLIQIIQGTAVVTILLNVVATWKQEAMRPAGVTGAPKPQPNFRESWDTFIVQHRAMRRLLVTGLGTLALSMSDIVLEPYGGQVLGLSVGATTKLTAVFAGGCLVGFAFASQILSRGGDPFRMSALGALLGLPAFAMVIAAAPMQSVPLFAFGVLLVGCGTGLFSHGTLTATMRFAPADQVGMALGAWGAVQATAAGFGAVLGGLLRDIVADFALFAALPRIADGYVIVYTLEILLLMATLAIMLPLLRDGRARTM